VVYEGMEKCMMGKGEVNEEESLYIKQRVGPLLGHGNACRCVPFRIHFLGKKVTYGYTMCTHSWRGGRVNTVFSEWAR
jgi:hypothetical protein